MSCSDIIPGVPWVPPMPGVIDIVGCPHWLSQVCICCISGPCAALIWVANCITRGSMFCLPRMVSLIWMACWWWGIMFWANVTSAWLCDCAAEVVVAAGELCGLSVVGPPHAGKSVTAATNAAPMVSNRRLITVVLRADCHPLSPLIYTLWG